MATYKVIQDIEAEDKLLGPLTLRQFIYAIIVAVSGFIMFKLATSNWLLALPMIPHTIFFAVLAAPFGHDQPNEVWLLAKVGFFLKPRKRIWNQSGVQELVTITAPKKVEHSLTNNLTQSEVKSRLQALASTIDSHGWSAKNVNVNLFGQPSYVVESDRLINPSTLPLQVSGVDITATDDMLDAQSNPTAQNLDRLMAASAQSHREKIVTQLQQPQPPAVTDQEHTELPEPNQWFLNKSQADANIIKPDETLPTVDSSGLNADEKALLEKLHTKPKRKKSAGPTPANSHMRTILPLSEQPEPEPTPPPVTPEPALPTPIPTPASPAIASSRKPATGDQGQETTPAGVNPVILQLANNDDLNVATIARQANKKPDKEPPKDEVVVSLH